MRALVLALAFVAASAAQQNDLKQAGVCSRCHVVQVIEWQTSAHSAAGAACMNCHGESKAHVANERNEVSPDRIRGAAADGLCQTCHASGCPSTGKTAGCTSCHNQHSLTNPEQIETFQGNRSSHPIQAEVAKLEEFHAALDRAEKLVTASQWREAKAAFEAALAIRPGDPKTVGRVLFCERRLNPSIPGFEIVGDEFDPVSGLARRVRVAGLGIEMLLVPAGEFDLGSDTLDDSKPVHTVFVEAFYLGRHELTQQQWEAVMGSNPSEHKDPQHPVERVSWEDAQAFLAKLSQTVPGGGFRLPTEAEWEYAARAGEPPADAAQLAQFAWFRQDAGSVPSDADFPRLEHFSTQPVGRKLPNAWGFFDMQGNVWEWTSSLFRPYFYDPADGRESLSAQGDRILRGGGYPDPAFLLDLALRHPERPTRRYRWNGFRVARSVP
ncbi:MAG: SUMF1/EgtB/PvdO family nonheme iron enzyme [Bryobacterales bacterium]